jgi:hypothetical protein
MAELSLFWTDKQIEIQVGQTARGYFIFSPTLLKENSTTFCFNPAFSRGFACANQWGKFNLARRGCRFPAMGTGCLSNDAPLLFHPSLHLIFLIHSKRQTLPAYIVRFIFWPSVSTQNKEADAAYFLQHPCYGRGSICPPGPIEYLSLT